MLLTEASLHMFWLTSEAGLLVAGGLMALFEGAARRVLLAGTRSERLMRRLSTVVVVNLCGERRLGIQTAHLVVDILAIVDGHFHAAVEVLQSRVAHLERLRADG